MEHDLTEPCTIAGLERLYRATTYRIDSGAAVVDVRIGACHAGVDALLARFDAADWAFVTAWNPGSRPTDAPTNAHAQARLLAGVRAAGFRCLEGQGIPDAPAWEPERSVWIAGIDRIAARKLGARFRQTAIVVGSLGGAAELLFL
jgi:hypothetical protein